MATAANRRVVPHCFSTGINLAASLHWMAATKNGHAQVLNGLGIELDEDGVEEFLVK